jgi:hypothetical protein
MARYLVYEQRSRAAIITTRATSGPFYKNRALLRKLRAFNARKCPSDIAPAERDYYELSPHPNR